MNIINLSPSDFYSQLNNEVNPYNACKPTSRIMFYRGNGLIPKYPSSKFQQEEDKIMDLLHTKEAVKWCKQRGYSKDVIEDPNLDNRIYPDWLDTKLFGKKVSEFTESCPIEKIVAKLANKEVIQTSGVFDFFSTKQNKIIKVSHSICLIGLYDDGFIIADPYNKDYHTSYKEGKGYKVQMSFTDARKILKGPTASEKWCHYKL